MIGKVEENSWYVIQTRSRFEKKCASLFEKMGVPVYLPLQKKMKVWSDRMKEVEEPLFRGYLFVKFTESERYRILNVPGIVRFVSFGGKYATLNNKQIDMVQKAISSDLDLELVDIKLTPGQEVLINSGPFKDNYARLVRHKGKGKLLLVIDSIGKGILLEIGRTRVEIKHKLAPIKALA
jgi:transcription antitermination factor NusG